MEKPDLQRMTYDERKTYTALLARQQTRPVPPQSLRHPLYLPGNVLALLGLPPILVGILSVRPSAEGAGVLPAVIGGIAALIIISIGGAVSTSRVAQWRAAEIARADAEIAAFIAGLDLPKRRASSGSGGPRSLREMQHQWYGSHSELNWRDRERAEMYGMDVETYISNVKESD